jgi:hypothetical protein
MKVVRVVGALVLALVIPAAAFAQASIAGSVKDTSGAVLPGVTVEASSPALIERTRSVVTDGSGLYRLVDLRPGTYTVTFTLAGFSPVRREGIELAGSFSATVSVELRVGRLEESVTVSGESPIVDVQSAVQQKVLNKDLIENLPTGRSATVLATLVPGVNVGGGFAGQSQDVGGNLGDAMTQLTIHGGRSTDFRLQVDGLPTNGGEGMQWTAFVPNMTSTQEVTVDTSGASAENSVGGVRINLIPQSGGNRFSASMFGTGVGESFQSDNFSQELKDRGLKAVNRIKLLYDINPGFGGPIKRDRVWFYTSARWQKNDNWVGGIFYNKNAYKPNAWTYDPDLTRQGHAEGTYRDNDLRLTWQASPRNRIAVYYDNSNRCLCPQVSATVSPEAAQDWAYPKQHLATVTWTAPVSSSVLLEAGVQSRGEIWSSVPRPGTESNPAGNQIPVVEQSTGLLYRGWQNTGGASYQAYTPSSLKNLRASMSWVTGAQNLKVGFTHGMATRDLNLTCRANSNCLVYRFNNGVPNQLTQVAYPFRSVTKVPGDGGIYVQEKWTIKRLTVNAGLRYDYEKIYFPESTNGPTLWTPNRNAVFPKVDFLSWKDISPRMGVAWDVTGDGKTALKVSMNRYVSSSGYQSTFGNSSNPVMLMASTVTRTWNDRTTYPAGDSRNGNYVPDCDLLNVLANGECGTVSDTKFGNPTVTTVVDPDILRGWGKRAYNWEFSGSVQRAIAPRVSAEVGYFRRWYGNFNVTQNRATSSSDYSAYNVVAPSDSRLPSGGGYAISGLYDLNPNKLGLVDNFLTFAKNFGDQIERWNGVDLAVAVRVANGVTLQGGVSSGRTLTDNCEVQAKINNPSQYNCRVETNFLTQGKFLGSYAVPKIGVQISGTFQSLPGPQVSANYVVPASGIIGLGRPLSAGSPTVNLLQAGTVYGERLNQFDMRFSKNLRFSGTRLALNLDLYNALNDNAVQQQNNSFASWQVPQIIQQSRFAKISAQFNF